MESTVKCLKCERILDEPSNLTEAERKPCPTCGSLSRRFELKLEDGFTLYDSVDTKLKRGGKGKPAVKTRTGDVRQANGKIMKLKRIIDRENDWYEEELIDPDTGEIVHKCAEPLSKHVDRGSAKPKKI